MSKLNTNSFDGVLQEIISSAQNFNDLKTITETMLDSLMKKEREIFLPQNKENKGNGFYSRSLSSGLGNLNLTIPRDRQGDFRPFILPEAYKRGEGSYQNLINSLILNSYSPNKVRAILRNLQLPYSTEEIESLKEEIIQHSKEFKNRQLPHSVFCLYIDAYHCDIKDNQDNRVKKGVIYTVIGIDLTGKKEVYGYYSFFGSENKERWLMIFNDLIKRGLAKPSLIVSDDFSGLTDAIATLFPEADHQLCFVHLQRNVRRNMGRNDAREFNEKLSDLKRNKDFDSAVNSFTALTQEYQEKYPHFIDHLISRKECYFTFLQYPEPIQKHIYTTNIVENFNGRLEVIRVNNGGFFQSIDIIDIAVYLLAQRLTSGKWKKINPHFKMCDYEINQYFNLKYNKEISD